MKDVIFDEFQDIVMDSLIRHKSILDITSKFSESSARVNRAIVKAVTDCGCIKINAHKQCVPTEEQTLTELANCFKSHLDGKICDNCREVIEREMGNHIFYLTSLCNSLDINLYDVLLKEHQKVNALGKFDFR
ncbi:DUF1573 domain-containing protein [Clostridium thermobutyricum]|uniref:DUF1573 domain-containing protein n=2 Tax=Clostridium thermobutyricum TaxID=29372 RepID=N9XYY5_9CLOT|nr:hypothetical protein [Clostridium thermobutyricum]ENZ00797.1 hypothetical protein HMPREF1092_02450 [Clostridium thermobutyricum]OPX46709.1 hypothetical protein CLTHE_25290 [Clostridium thermobutyricum DSM 4928]